MQLLFQHLSHGQHCTGIGGGLLTPETYQTENKKLVGSMLIFEMESLEAVRQLVESDVYWTSNVVRDSSILWRCRLYLHLH